jgi:hypothetical protein
LSVAVTFLERLRLSAWWEHKLSPVLATLYATAVLLHIPFASLWREAGFALLALASCASYVSVLNDLTDANEDRASGKPDRWHGSTINPALCLLACVAAGIGVLIVLRNDILLSCVYLLSWLSFALYSVPPIRLKVRGVCGVLADACGAHLFPALFALILIYHWTARDGPSAWTIVVALWSLAVGIRGILWHQLEDLVSDERIGLRTFAGLYGAKAAQRAGITAFVVEIAAFAAMLWITRSALAVGFLALYGFFVLKRRRLLGISLAIITPGAAFRMAMAEYYIVLFPLAFLLTAAWQQPMMLVLLLLHAPLFSRQSLYALHEIALMRRTGGASGAAKTAVR